jgi:DNA-binding IclR family transcriptional regulator
MDSTVSKGLTVLELLVRAAGPMRLSAVAQELGLQKSNAHRTLATLIAGGFVVQDEESGRYRPSLKLFELGSKVVADHPARRAAAPYMQDLHKNLGETVNLYVLDKNAVLVIEKLLSPRPLRFSSQPGSRLPLATTAAGRAMLAHEPDPESALRASLDGQSPPGGTDIDSQEVLAELGNIRVRGYAEAVNSWTPGIFSIAAPILRTDGRAGAAIGVSGPIERQTESNRAAIIEALLTTSARIAENAPLF